MLGGKLTALGAYALALALALSLGPSGAAWPVRPVVSQTGPDGRLIGLEADLELGIWRPIAAVAYGLGSGRLRYRAGMAVETGLDLPLVDVRLGDVSAALVDWPRSPILGREGQSGVEVGWSLGPTRFSGFFGTLWARGARAGQEEPPVGYVVLDASRSFDLPFELRLRASTETIFGAVFAGRAEGTVRSTTHSLGLRLGELSLTGRWGTLSNEAGLDGFEFTTGVRGIAKALKGHEFWHVALRRGFSMHETAIALPIPPELPRGIPRELPVKLEGSFSFQAGGATGPVKPERTETDGTETAQPGGQQKQEDGGEESSDMGLKTETLFSWGVSATLTVHEFSLRAELVIAQDGTTTFNFGF